MPGTTQDASRTFYNNVQIGGGGRFYANGFAVDGVTNTWANGGGALPDGFAYRYFFWDAYYKGLLDDDPGRAARLRACATG